MIQRYIAGSFRSDVNVTVGVDFSSKSVVVEGKTIQLQIWDTVFKWIYSLARTFTVR